MLILDLKNKFHKTKFFNFFFYDKLKRIFFENIKIITNNCIKIKNFIMEKNYYFFFEKHLLKINNIIYNITIFNFSNKIIYFFFKKCFLNMFYNIKNFTKFYFMKTKCIFYNFLVKKIVFFNFKFNNIVIFNNFKKKTLNNFIYYLLNNNNFLYIINNNNYKNFFLKNKTKIFHFKKKNYSNEIFFSNNNNVFLTIMSNIYIKKQIEKNFFFQNYDNYIKKIILINLNLNILLYSKNISCKHKILFYNKIPEIKINKKILNCINF